MLPISQVPSVAGCIYYSTNLLPLETILRLGTPERWNDEFAEVEAQQKKKTYRDGQVHVGKSAYVAYWTAGDVMQGWALKRGYRE